MVKEGDELKLIWKYEGGIPFKNELFIDKVRPVDPNQDYISRNSAIKIN